MQDFHLKDKETVPKREIYCFGDYRLDTAKRQLWRAREPVTLKSKQFDLLLYFVENSGRIIKKEELFSAVWEGVYVEENTLAGSVSRLRKLLADIGGGERLITTVPKLGYQFTAQVTDCERTDSDHLISPADEKNAFVVEEYTAQHFRGVEIISTANSVEPQKTGQIKAETTDDLSKAEKEVAALRPPNILEPPARSFSPSLFFVLALIGLALVGTGFVIYQNKYKVDPRIVATTDGIFVKSQIIVRNVAVEAAQETFDTGIHVEPGDVIAVSAEGKYSFGTDEIWTYEGNDQMPVSGTHAFQEADPWALVGWIGTGDDKTGYFQVSRAGPLTAKRSGTLYFAINDWKGEYANNRGGLNLTVEITRNSRIFAKENDIAAAWGSETVNLSKNDTLAINASGKVAYWIGGEFYDLGGSDHKLDALLAPNVNARSLIGKIGSGEAFKVGTNYLSQKVSDDGWLHLSVNEQIGGDRPAAYMNNSGDVSIEIEVTRARKELKNAL